MTNSAAGRPKTTSRRQDGGRILWKMWVDTRAVAANRERWESSLDALVPEDTKMILTN